MPHGGDDEYDRKPFGVVIAIAWDDEPAVGPLALERVKALIPEIHWDGLPSGVELSPSVAERLWGLWGPRSEREQLDDVDPAGKYVEGAVTQVLVNRYERDPAAREACLSHWGYACMGCGLALEDVYGGLARGFIHVHHLRELAMIGEGYEVDPVHDLRPLCPNCHAMVHRRRPALTLEELRAVIRVPGQ